MSHFAFRIAMLCLCDSNSAKSLHILKLQKVTLCKFMCRLWFRIGQLTPGPCKSTERLHTRTRHERWVWHSGSVMVLGAGGSCSLGRNQIGKCVVSKMEHFCMHCFINLNTPMIMIHDRYSMQFLWPRQRVSRHRTPAPPLQPSLSNSSVQSSVVTS